MKEWKVSLASAIVDEFNSTNCIDFPGAWDSAKAAAKQFKEEQ